MQKVDILHDIRHSIFGRRNGNFRCVVGHVMLVMVARKHAGCPRISSLVMGKVITTIMYAQFLPKYDLHDGFSQILNVGQGIL